MSETTFRRLNRCGIDNCKATVYYLQDGQWFCKNGHLREGELDIDEDEFTAGNTGARAKKKEEEKEKPAHVLRGRRAYELFLKCIQLILRKQVLVLVHEKGFPEELEAVVRDLWALRLQKLLERHKSSSAEQADDREQYATDEEASGSGTTGASSYSSDYFSSDIEIESALAQEPDYTKRRMLKRTRKLFQGPGLIVTLAICYLGAAMLRVPVSLGEIYQWMEARELPYTVALQEIPEKMRQLLPGTYRKALQPLARLEQRRLQRTIQDLVVSYSTQFGITFPELNWPILTLKYIKGLGLPLEVFSAVKQLIKLKEISIKFDEAPRVKRHRGGDWPEQTLMSLVLIAAKLAWGLDGIKRMPEDNMEPAAIILNQKCWERFLAANKFKGDAIFDYKDMNILKIPGEELDAYMDWYERTWLSSEGQGKTKLSEHLLSLFPTSQKSTFGDQQFVPEHSDLQDIKTLHANVEVVQKAETESEMGLGTNISVGEHYPIWRLDSELPPHAMMLLDAASTLVCTSREYLCKSLRHMEFMFRDCEFVKQQRRRSGDS
ncbi:hypothetical protein BDZ91DRAFT_672662 [Kalaharituber pfeilii]|nr:hypothetical protein BDZ91DRAFT_672662 [Kalaharituber pfeilii]